MRIGVGLSLAAAAMGWSARARAVEREHHVGIDAGGAILVIGDKSTADVGAGFGAHYAYGLSDAFMIMAEGAWSLVAVGETAQDAKTPHTRPASVTNADVGIAYVFDVMRWVPYAGVLIGGYALYGGTIDGVKILPGAALALGLDYRFNRNLSAGVAFRQHMIANDMTLTTYPSFTQAFARVEYTWGW